MNLGAPAHPAASGCSENLVDEMTAQTPAEAFRYMRRWHTGAAEPRSTST